MVEAGANEIPEAEILDALDIAHDADQEALRRSSGSCARRPARRSSRSSRRRSTRACSRQIRASHGAAARRGHAGRTTSSSARTRRRRSRRRSSSSTPATPTPRPTTEYRQRAQLAFDRLEKQVIRERIARREEAPRRPRREGDPPDHDRGRRHAPRTHGSALFTRGQTQALSRRRAGHAEGGDAPRHPRARRPRSSTGTTTTSRRSRWARPASCAAPSAATSATGRSPSARWCRSIPTHGGLPVHDPRRVGHPRVQRLVLDGLGLRLLAVADGRRRADQRSRWRASPWASSRRATTTPSSPTSPASRTTSATWTSRSPAPTRASPPCRWTSRSRA